MEGGSVYVQQWTSFGWYDDDDDDDDDVDVDDDDDDDDEITKNATESHRPSEVMGTASYFMN